MAVVIETTIGDITIDLFVQERPRACLNFLKLCKLKYYNYNLFHHVERNFIAQTGDPTGAGDGGESVWGVVEGPHKRFFEAEGLPKIRHSSPGLVSLVSVGKNMVSSQLFFTLADDLTSLDGIHCVFGEITEGLEILRQLNETIVNEKFRPYQDVRITHTVILEDPFDDPRGFRIPSRSPSPSAERLKNGKIGADEDIDDTEGKSAEEIHEMLAAREANARATILEIVGDLPSADIAPPENVLFVCKLNPVTNDDDLEIIFSRFGKIVGCEVIRDKQTGDSLQYAFVEFEDKKSCEAAYFKMDNVLIDDRRIHVDFSQSVAKVQWRGKGRGLIHKGKDNDRKLDFNNYRDVKPSERQKRSDVGRRSPNRNRDSERNRNSDRGKESERNRDLERNRDFDRNRETNKHRSPNRRARSPSPYKNYDNRRDVYRRRSPFRDNRRGRNWNNSYHRDGRDFNRRPDYNLTDKRNRLPEKRRDRSISKSPEKLHDKSSERNRSLKRKQDLSQEKKKSSKKKTKKSRKKSSSSSESSNSDAQTKKSKKKSKKRKKNKKKSSSSSDSSSDTSD